MADGFIDDGRVHTLPNGKAYISIGGKVTYISPSAMGTGGPPEKGSVFHSGSQFDQNTGDWENPINWGNVLSLATGAGLGAGALSAAGAFGGAGAGGAASSAPIGPGLSGAGIGPGLAGVGTAGTGGAMAGGGILGGIKTGLDVLGKVSPILGGIENGRAQGRIDESQMNNRQDQLRLQAAQLLEQVLMNRGNLDLNQRQFALGAPAQRMRNATRGDVLANAQPSGVSGPIVHTRGQIPQLTGGLSPALFSGSTRSLGQQVSRDALMSQMKGDAFDPLPPPNIPSPTPQPSANGFDTALNIGSTAGALSGIFDDPNSILNKAKQRQLKPMPQPQGPMSPLTMPTFGTNPFGGY